jgi:hypothetical protein
MTARIILACTALCAAAAVPAATAEAKRGYFVEPPGASTKLVLRGSNGYRISVKNLGHRTVQLSASKGSAAAEYTVKGHASRHGIYANFGKLGRVAVRFDGTRQPPRRGGPPLFKCKGDPAIREAGSFRGTIRFGGEEGFTSVSARRARGSVVRSFRRVCAQPRRLRAGPALLRARARPKPSLTVFALASRVRNRTVFVETVGAEFPARKGRTAFFGFDVMLLLERRGRIAISRSAFVEGHRQDVTAGDSRIEPASGTIAPRPPFAGTAAYSKPPGGAATLTGSLTVSLPGAGEVPLTGDDFKAALCRALKEKQIERCTREVAAELGPKLGATAFAGPAQGSGSQSQVLWDDRLSWSR